MEVEEDVAKAPLIHMVVARMVHLNYDFELPYQFCNYLPISFKTL